MAELTELELAEIEELAKSNAAETYWGPLVSLVQEVRRLRRTVERSGRVVCGEGWTGEATNG